ncbi:MAG: LysR family transcriptional regulator [Arcobacter sp.]|nr:LysR family transcriptional regulator [Arcobacter sp.]
MDNVFNVNGNIWIKKDDRNFIGRGRIELLQNIHIHGSISKAAKKMKMSYKAAWDSVDIMNKLSHKELVTKVIGGKGGGGTVITAHAKEIIESYNEVLSLHRKYCNTLSKSFNKQIDDLSNDEPVFSRLTGEIFDKRNIKENYELSIKLNDGQILTSIENKKFVIEKDLKINDKINLLIETSNIVLNKENTNNSSRNQLSGYITSINDDGINSNITINCNKEESIHAKITSSSSKKLGFKVGDEIFATFKAYNVNII